MQMFGNVRKPFIVISFTAQIYAEMEEEKWHSLDLLEWEIWDMRC